MPSFDDDYVTKNVGAETLEMIKARDTHQRQFQQAGQIFHGKCFGGRIFGILGKQSAQQVEVEVDTTCSPQRSKQTIEELAASQPQGYKLEDNLIQAKMDFSDDNEDINEMTEDAGFATFFIGQYLHVLMLLSAFDSRHARYGLQYQFLFNPASFFQYIYSDNPFVFPFSVYRRAGETIWREAWHARPNRKEGLRMQVWIGKIVFASS
jgi:hypothetical protein